MLVIDAVDGAADRDRRRIDALRRQQLVLGRRGWRSGSRSTGPRPAPAHHRAVDEVVVPEERARLVDPALGDQPADARAADDEIVVAHRIDLLDAEAVARPSERSSEKLPERSRPNRKLPPTHTSAGVQPARRARRGRTCSGSHRDSSCVKRTKATPSMPALRSASTRCGVGHQQRRRLVGPDDARRVRIEGHHDRRRALLAGLAADALDDLLVAAVQAVEVAERDDRPAPVRRARIVGIEDHVTHGRRLPRSRASGHRRPAPCPLGQAGAGRGVAEVVRHVGEEGAAARRSASPPPPPGRARNATGAAARAARPTTTTSSPSSSGHDASGMALQSVR